MRWCRGLFDRSMPPSRSCPLPPPLTTKPTRRSIERLSNASPLSLSMPSPVAGIPSRLASSPHPDCPPGEWPQARGHDPRGKYPQRLCRTEYLQICAMSRSSRQHERVSSAVDWRNRRKRRTWNESASASSAAATSAPPISRRRRPFRSSTSRAVADLRPDAAEARGGRVRHSARRRSTRCSPIRRSRSSSTSPCRSPMSRSACEAIAAGKHVHSEKPLGIDTAEARQLLDAAQASGAARRLRARHLPRRRPPDLPQADRRGRHRPAARRHRLLHVPRPRALASRARPSTTSAAAARCSTWAPYYITDLVNLLGPVARVAGDHVARARANATDHQPAARRARRSRSRSRPMSPATLEFVSGAVVTMG